jgi:oligosaccharide repeat unit polymerase
MQNGPRQNKQNAVAKIVFFCGIAFSSVIMIIACTMTMDGKLILGIVSLTVFTISGVLSVKGDLLHPFVWFNIPFLIYSVSAPVLYLVGEYRMYSSYFNSLILEYLAILFFSIVVGCRRMVPTRRKLSEFYLFEEGNSFFFIICFVFSVFFLHAYVNAGMVTKSEKHFVDSPIYLMDFVYHFLNLSVCIYLLDAYFKEKHFNWMVVIFYGAFLLLTVLIAGERAFLYRFVIMGTITYDLFYKKINKGIVLLAMVIGIYLQSVLAELKMYYFTREVIEWNMRFDFSSIIKFMFGSEFRTASENLSILIEHVPETYPFAMGKTWVADVMRAIIPGFLFPRDFLQTSSVWFNETFFTDWWERGGGAGFSLVGSGYLNFGIPGVLLVFSILGVGVRKFYRVSVRNLFWMIVYISAIPIFINSIRADISVPLSQIWKHVFFPLLVIICLGLGKREIVRGIFQRRGKNIESG